jgi:hypothetical protein
MFNVSNSDAFSLNGSFRTAIMSSQFNSALGALLTATDEITQAVCRKYKTRAPYKVTKGEFGFLLLVLIHLIWGFFL